MSTTIAIVTLVGFAIQRALELLDPLINRLAGSSSKSASDPQKEAGEAADDKGNGGKAGDKKTSGDKAADKKSADKKAADKKDSDGSSDASLTAQTTDPGRKKWLMGFCSLLLGLGATLTIGISLLQHLNPDLKGSAVDVIITALVVGASTEGLNTITKYFGYLKDKTKSTLSG